VDGHVIEAGGGPAARNKGELCRGVLGIISFSAMISTPMDEKTEERVKKHSSRRTCDNHIACLDVEPTKRTSRHGNAVAFDRRRNTRHCNYT
jgi:hypothetical protein